MATHDLDEMAQALARGADPNVIFTELNGWRPLHAAVDALEHGASIASLVLLLRCGADVEALSDSDLYLRYVIGQLDPEVLHTTPERHIRCNPVLAQFIVDERFPPVLVQGDFAKSGLDPAWVQTREQLVTRGWQRLLELQGADVPLSEYPLAEFRQSDH